MGKIHSNWRVAVLFFLSCSTPKAQIIAWPESLRVVVAPGEDTTVALTLSNAAGSQVGYCLDFVCPLQRRATRQRGNTCGPPGQRLFSADENDVGRLWSPHDLTMTSDGRLFVSEHAGTPETHELDSSLHLVRSFEHPTVAEVAAFPRTVGVTFNADTGTLWWTNAEVSGLEVRRVLLLEGTLDGVATGRRIELPRAPGPAPYPYGYPAGAAYDRATTRFYYVDRVNEDIWAVDTAGVVPPGYPLRLARYPEANVGQGLHAHGGSTGGPESVRLEVPIALGGESAWSRVVVTDPLGRDLGAETPIPPLGGFGGIVTGNAVRSPLDPNGVMYVAYASFDSAGVAAIRPVPLAPTWLSLDAWNGTVEAGASAEVALTFRAGERENGEYRSILVVEDTTGSRLAAVPLTLVVDDGTAGEDAPGAAPVATLDAAPNPAAGPVTTSLSLRSPATVRITVHDVLGRAVAVLADGPLPVGRHVQMWTPGRAAPGAYLIRAQVTPAGRRAVVVTRVVTLLDDE
jgi:hypothetical protein